MNKCVAAAADGNVRNYTVAGNSAAVADDDGLWKEAKDMSQEYKGGCRIGSCSSSSSSTLSGDEEEERRRRRRTSSYSTLMAFIYKS